MNRGAAETATGGHPAPSEVRPRARARERAPAARRRSRLRTHVGRSKRRVVGARQGRTMWYSCYRAAIRVIVRGLRGDRRSVSNPQALARRSSTEREMTAVRRPIHERPRWWDEANDRAMLICRISDRKQKDGVSLEAQDHHGREYADRVGLRAIIAKPFQESAKKSQLRAEFHAAIDEARRQKIKHLIFYVWDRITRNFTDAEMLEEMIRDGEIVVHIASGGTVLHADSDDSEFFLFDINVAQAKQDNRNRRRKTIDGMEQRCRNGWYPSRTPSFYAQAPVLDEQGRPKRRGWTVVGPTEEGRRLVRREMELHLKGFSLERIRRKCVADGLVPARYLATYTATQIDKHLKNIFYAAIPNPHPDPERPNETYRSQFVWRGNWYEGKHEPIFSAAEWEQIGRTSFRRRSPPRTLTPGARTRPTAASSCGAATGTRGSTSRSSQPPSGSGSRSRSDRRRRRGCSSIRGSSQKDH